MPITNRLWRYITFIPRRGAQLLVGRYLLHTSVLRTIIFNCVIAALATVSTAFLAEIWTSFANSSVSAGAVEREKSIAELNRVLKQTGLSATEHYPSQLPEELRGHFRSICIAKEKEKIQLLGVSNYEGQIKLFASSGCSRAGDANILPLMSWKIASSTALLGTSYLPTYTIDVFEDNLSDLIFSRIGPDLGGGEPSKNSDGAQLASKAIADQLFSYLDAKRDLRRYQLLAKTSSVFHRAVLFVFLFGLFGSLSIYYFVMHDKAARTQYSLETVRSRLRFYHEIINVLPTVSLICTMTGLMFTLMEFLGRNSPDPTEAVRANSAALGGIILAFTTTILASFLFILGWNLIIITAEARLGAEYEQDARGKH